MKKRPLRVLWLPVDDGGCGWYRVKQWHEYFERMDEVDSVLMTGKEEDPLALIKWADIIVSRINGAKYLREVKENIDPLKPIVFDHDDNTMEVLPTSEHYMDFGTRDAWAQLDGKTTPVWVTGKTEGFNRYKNLWGQMGLLYLLGIADMITTPVPKLTQYYMQYASEECIGAVVPNSINPEMYPEGDFIAKNKKKKEIRIGWQGGVSHLGDWQEIKEPLEKVLKDYPEVTLHIMGSYYRNQFKSFADRIKYYPWTPWKGYTYRLKTMALDGAIIPLADQAFNEYKSEIKFTEFNQLGVPCIVKDMLPYSLVAKGGKNAWTYKTPEEFEKRFREMLEDIKKGGVKGKKYVKEMQKWVKEERDAKTNAKKLVELYKTLLSDEVAGQII
jgi:hypothetical protein